MIAPCKTLCYPRSDMTATAGADQCTASTFAPATLYLVPPTAERTSEGRRLAAPMISTDPHEQTLALRGVHPDLIELTPEEDKERLGIERVREVLRSVQYSPVQGTRKVFLLPQAETLTVEAANALLKTLEEPPAHSVFVLLAAHSGDLLPTIVSRSRVVRVPPRSAVEEVHRLTETGYSLQEAGWLRRLPLRVGELDQLLETPVDATASRTAAAKAARALDAVDVIASACSDASPIVRAAAHAEILLRATDGDSDLLSAGVAFLASQRRETLFLFIQEFHAAAFQLAHACESGTGVWTDTERDLLDRASVSGLLTFCARSDGSYRVLSVHAPAEAVFLTLFACLEEMDR